VTLEQWNCIDFDEINLLGGNWDGNFVYGLQIDTRRCMNSTLGNYITNNVSCIDENSLENAFGTAKTGANYFFSILYLKGNPTLTDFNNPLKSTLVNVYEMLSLNFTKRRIQTIKNVSLLNDVGWIFPDSSTQSQIVVEKDDTDFAQKDPSIDAIFTYITYMGTTNEQYSRSYEKIQTVIAQIGGFSSFFYILILNTYIFLLDIYKNLTIMQRLNFPLLATKKIKNEKNRKKERLQ